LTIKSSILTEREKAVNSTIIMRLSEQQSLEYLEVGFECSVATFYREKKKVEEMILEKETEIQENYSNDLENILRKNENNLEAILSNRSFQAAP
jgi:hypothetical protein